MISTIADERCDPRRWTHINEPLQVLVEVRQVVLPLLVLGDELGLSLQEFLPLLFKRLPLRLLVIYPRRHENVLVRLRVLRVLGEELFDRDQG